MKTSLMLFLAAIVALTLAFVYFNAKREYEETIEQLLVEKRELTTQLEQARVALPKKEERAANTVDLESWDTQRMQENGLVDPVRNIIADLRRHSELIPFDGSHGGRMDFYVEDKIWILTNKWVLAYFEDGHNSGHLLLEYSISKKGKINWKRLSAQLN